MGTLFSRPVHKSPKCKMDDLRINLSAITAEFISENSQIPPDITFRFTEDDPGEVSAHKIILAMVSEVFRNMFFVHNTMDKSASEIDIKGISRSAFQIMVDAIYNAKSVAESLRGKTLHEYFGVLYVVTKYEIPQLVLAVKKCFSSFPFTEDSHTVLQVATDAMEYLPTFTEEAQKVLHLCAKFLDSKFTDVESFRQFVTKRKLRKFFVAKNGDQFAVVHKLLVLIDEIKANLCSNCASDPCLHGVAVNPNQIRVGLKVADNPNATRTGTTTQRLWNPKLEYFHGEIVDIQDRNKVQVRYTCIYSYVQGYTENFRVNGLYGVVKNGELRFVFRCK